MSPSQTDDGADLLEYQADEQPGPQQVKVWLPSLLGTAVRTQMLCKVPSLGVSPERTVSSVRRPPPDAGEGLTLVRLVMVTCVPPPFVGPVGNGVWRGRVLC
jgi:hypothetical protein